MSPENPSGRLDKVWVTITGGNGLEVVVLSVAIMLILFALAATVRAGTSDAFREDLSLDGALDEIAEMIAERGSRGVAEYHQSELRIGGATYPLDSLAVTGDSLLYPSLAVGGFLRDQMELFNAYAARRVVHGALGHAESGAEAVAPSVFRLARADSGFHYLSSTLNRYALVVPSPFAEREWRTVRTADWQKGPALLGLREGVGLRPVAGELTSPRRLSHEECSVKGESPTSSLLYCRSVAGADVNAAFDWRFDWGGSPTLASGASLTEGRRGGLWLNGKRERASDVVRAGDLLFSETVGPALLSDVEDGVLSGYQWLNGRRRITRSTEGTLQSFGRAGRSQRGVESALTLSLRAEFSRALDHTVDRFMAANRDDLEDMSVIVADVGTGEILGISQARPRDTRAIRVFEPVLLGSMVKPLLAAAILTSDFSLAALQIQWGGGRIDRVAGIPLAVPFSNPLNGCPTIIDLTSFLRCSINQYAVELLVRSLQENAGGNLVMGGRVSTELLERSSLTNGLLTLFDDADVVVGRQEGRTDRIWSRAGPGGGASVPLDRSIWPWISRPWFVNPDAEGTPIDWLARFAFGGWENRWSLLGAAEGYARVATGRRVALTVLQTAEMPDPFPALSPEGRRAVGAVRGGLRLVGENGTAPGLNDTLRRAIPDSIVVLAKTGTLNEITPRRQDDDIFVKALALVIGRPEAAGLDAAVSCGLVVTTYFEFRQDYRERTGRGTLLNLHVDFAEGALAPLLRDAWPSLEPCEAHR